MIIFLRVGGIQRRDWDIGDTHLWRVSLCLHVWWWFSFLGPVYSWQVIWLISWFPFSRDTLPMWDCPWENRSFVICFDSPGGNSKVVLLSPSLGDITAFMHVPGSWEPEKEHRSPPIKLERPREYMWQNRLHTPGFLSPCIPEFSNIINSLIGLYA